MFYWGQTKMLDMAYAGRTGGKGSRQGCRSRRFISARNAQTDYKNVGKVIAAINRGGVIKVGFITEPRSTAVRGTRLRGDRFHVN